jgi:hypothetical protein
VNATKYCPVTRLTKSYSFDTIIKATRTAVAPSPVASIIACLIGESEIENASQMFSRCGGARWGLSHRARFMGDYRYFKSLCAPQY